MSGQPHQMLECLIGFAGLLSPDGRVLHVNAAALAAGGISLTEVLGKHAWDCYWFSYSKESQELVRAAVQRAASGEAVRLNASVRMAGDTRRWVEIQLAPVREGGEGITHLLASAVDVSEHKHAVESLRLALRGAGICAWDWNLSSGAFSWSGETESVCGFGADNAPATPEAWHAFVHPEDSKRVSDALHEVLGGRSPEFRSEFRIIPAHGDTRWLLGVGRVVERHENGAPARMAGMYVDIGKRKRMEALLSKRTALLEAFTGNAPVGLAFVDTDCRYVRVNDALARMNRRPAEAHIGHTVEEMVPRLWPTIAPLLRGALAGTPAVNVDISGAAPRAGSSGSWLVSYYPVYFEERIMGVGIVVVDISPLKRAEALLREADQRKDEFLATLAHELRNPLAPISNAIAILRLHIRDNPPADTARAIMERQLRQLVRLVDDLLDVSRITRGKLTLRRERVNVRAVVENAVEAALPDIERAKHRLTLSFAQEPLYVEADPVRLSQIVSNLLHNACGYTRSPGGHIRLAASREGPDVILSVRDNGIGIPPEYLPRVFDLFAQFSPAPERSQGLGIGLALTKNLVEMHGGTIAAESPGSGQGSTFTVRLPAAKDADAGEAPQPAAGPASLSGRRILVVDDNEDAARSLAMLLRMHANVVEVAFSGAEALEKFSRFSPQIVLLDIGMPGMSGHETCRAIRATPGGGDTIIVAVTGWGHDEDRRKSKDAGFDGHLVKPLDHPALLDLLQALPARPRKDG